MTRPPRPGARTAQRRSSPAVDRSNLALAAVAIVAISSSAVLVRWADAPAEALAFWRTAGGALILAPAARRAAVGPTRTQWWGIVVAGAALAIHFSTWLASLELTSVAASVTLVTTVPLLIAIGWAIAGRRPPTRTWLAIGVALAGVLIITLGDTSGGSPDGAGSAPLLGNSLALVGAGAMAVYLVAGDQVRAGLSTAGYASRAYAVAAAGLLVSTAVRGVDLVGYDRATWLAIAAMILGPQLAGHTVLNLLLERFGPVTLSTLLLAEPIGATLLAWMIFGDVPPASAWIGGPLVIGAVALQLRTGGNDDDDDRSTDTTTNSSSSSAAPPPLSGGGRRGAERPGPGG